MEFEDASDEEAPPLMPKKREMSKHAQLQMISLLQAMDKDGLLEQGSVTTIAKRFSMACSTVN